jgi:putative sigma-54 modulation protein
MQTEYTGRQMNVTQKLRAQATLGLERIERVVGRTAKAHIILTTEKYRQMAEVTVNTRKHGIVGMAESTVMESALHDALDKAEKQALKHKEKIIGRKRNAKVGKEDIYPESIAI